MFQIKLIPYTLHFKQPAGTSRGVYTKHKVWYVVFIDKDDSSHYGIGECAPLHDLSCDYTANYIEELASFCKLTEDSQTVNTELLRNYPSILFGMETAMQHYRRGKWRLWDTAFSRHEEGIPINGLIWMSDYENMLQQIETKLKQGFRCIKLKIGAIDFEKELALLRFIRLHYPADEITIRVDANGNFSNEHALTKLGQLAELDIHSIEQPIKAGQWTEMAKLTSSTPLPIALDEELIGINNPVQKKLLLETIRPQYIILKPSLHGGLTGASEWIELARELSIDWWVTSALESNIGLNCIAQWCATFNNSLPQGLGTGMLYTNNIAMPLAIEKDRLWLNPEGSFPDITALQS
ncbi:o-succinylbenzoate synthase [Massilibacteroides sp.]|uniref:o-succinylbenzoate synthase n=1 Tax=Massilibacteroides sp. TaxID=2034766 RepID=UPI002629EB6C|nr:o-succinylbenzoate synthase [Massilibacteroides sp.]MDD4514604.1 o-succinylbenzoate synthase [Massilibacteroides sp.]